MPTRPRRRPCRPVPRGAAPRHDARTASVLARPGRRRHRPLADPGPAGAGGPRAGPGADLPARRRRGARLRGRPTCPTCWPGRSGSASTGSTSPTPSSRPWCRCSTTLSEDAADLGAVNTVVLRDGRRVGHNTDWSGYAAALAAGAARRASATGSCSSAPAARASRSATACSPRGVGTARRARRRPGAGARVRRTAGRSGSATTPGRGRRPTSRRALAAARRPRERHAGRHARPPGLPVAGRRWSRPGLWVSDVVYFPLETELVAPGPRARLPVLPGGGDGGAAGGRRLRAVHRPRLPTPRGCAATSPSSRG